MHPLDLRERLPPGCPLGHTGLQACQLLRTAPTHRPPFFASRSRLASTSSRSSAVRTAARVQWRDAIPVERTQHPAGVLIQHRELVGFGSFCLGNVSLELLSQCSYLRLQLFAHGRFHLLLRLKSWLGRIAQRMELADLVGDLWPQLLHRLQLALLGIGNRAQHLHPQRHHWRKQGFHHCGL